MLALGNFSQNTRHFLKWTFNCVAVCVCGLAANAGVGPLEANYRGKFERVGGWRSNLGEQFSGVKMFFFLFHCSSVESE